MDGFALQQTIPRVTIGSYLLENGISCELPKGSQLFYASIATAAKVL
jgi:hypothetical protein